MKRLALLWALGIALSSPALAQHRPPPGGPGGGREGPPGRAYANPSAGIAADLELARLTAERKGRWYALRQTAAPDAVMFVPQMVLAQSWLKNRSDPGRPLKLRPARVWASCDGSLIVTSGAWQEGDRHGWYTAVWQRQPDGAYRWVFEHDGVLKEPLAEPDMIEAKVAECPPRPAGPPPAPPEAERRRKPARPEKPAPVVFDPTSRSGRSRDGSLTWAVAAEPDGKHRFTASMRAGGEMRSIRDETVAAPGS